MTESHLRSIVKATSYRVLGSFGTFVIGYIITGDTQIAASISVLELVSKIGDQGEDPLASAEQMEGFYQHLQQTIADIGFLQPERSKSIMRRLRRIFNRTQLDTKELDILRGILRFSQNHNSSTKSAKN